MTDITGAINKIQTEEVEFKAGVSEGTFNKMGATINGLVEATPTGVTDSNITIFTDQIASTSSGPAGPAMTNSYASEGATWAISTQYGDTSFATPNYDLISVDSANGRTIALIAGTYLVECVGSAVVPDTHNGATTQTRFYNVTDASEEILGIQTGGNFAGGNAARIQPLVLTGIFTIAGTKKFRWQAKYSTAAAVTWGGPWENQTAKTEASVWSYVKITKLA